MKTIMNIAGLALALLSSPVIATEPVKIYLMVAGPGGVNHSVCVLDKPCTYTKIVERSFVEKGAILPDGQHELTPGTRKVGIIVEIKHGEYRLTHYYLEGERRVGDGHDWLVLPAQRQSSIKKAFELERELAIGPYTVVANRIIH